MGQLTGVGEVAEVGMLEEAAWTAQKSHPVPPRECQNGVGEAAAHVEA